MAEGKESFLLYRNIQSMVKKLSDVKAGKLFKIILAYVNDENPTINDEIIDIAFEPIKQSLKKDLRKYESVIERNRSNGKLGGRPKKEEPIKPTGLIENPLEPKKADIELDIVIDKNKETPNPLKGEDPNKIDFQKLGEYYNSELCPQLPKIILPLSKGRKAAVMARVKEYGKQKVVDLFPAVKESSFLLGENEHNWKANFDWLFKPTNFLKVIEGTYMDTEADKRRNKKLSSEQIAERALLNRQKQNEELFRSLDENAKNCVLPPKGLSILKNIK